MNTFRTRPPVAARAPRRRRAMLAVVALAASAGAGLASSLPVQAADHSVDDAVFRWGLSNEAGGGAYAGTCNFLTAGVIGDPGGSFAWTEAQALELGYSTSSGNVTVVKPNASGDLVQASWETRCQKPDGTGNVTVAAGTNPAVPASYVVGPTATNVTRNEVVITGGTGTVDPDSNTATIQWDGDFSVVFYGGFTFWTGSDPKLTVNADGSAQLTATARGYGSSMEADENGNFPWTALTPREIVLADLTGVTVDEDGFSVTPDYLGVTLDTGTGTPQTTGASWGSFPQSFVDFQVLTGQSSYWYSSGGARDAAKPASPLTVGYTLDEGTDPEPNNGSQVITVEVPESGTEPGGEFLWTIDEAGAVDLGTTTDQGTYLQATGNITPISVTDTRVGVATNAWSLSGQVSDFEHNAGGAALPGEYLGWTPQVINEGAGAIAGDAVASGYPTGNGLASGASLASADDGHDIGTAQVGAGLDLRLPAETDAGTYTATLTITALS